VNCGSFCFWRRQSVFFVSNSSGTAERVLALHRIQTEDVWFLARESLKVKVKGQGHQGQKTAWHFPALSMDCVRFMFGETSLASSWLLIYHWFAFSALTLTVERKEEHPVCKNRLIRCWHGYLSAVRCKWFANGPADAPHHLLLH